jgi:hypothetical protein
MGNKNKFGHYFTLAVLFIACCLVTNNQAEATSSFAGGTGTADDPYLIASCTQLQAVGSYTSKHFLLIEDIDCSDTANWNTNQGFAPIASFTGSFDGRNHTISGLFINRTVSYDDEGGLFKTVTNGTVKNVKLTGASITFTNSSRTGGIIGNASGATISGVSFSGNLTGQVTGGVVGFLQVRSTLCRSSSHGNITDTGGYGGGLIGFMRDSDVSDCYTDAALVGNNSTGGLSCRIWSETGAASVVRSYSGGSVKSSNYRNAFIAFVEDYSSGAYSITFTDDLSASSYVHDAQSYKLTNFYGNTGASPATPAITNGLFDKTLANGGIISTCGSYGTQNDCSNVDSTTLYNTSTAAPFKVGGTQKWNFDTVWQTRDGGLPTLRDPVISPDAPTDLATSDIGGLKTTLSWDVPASNGGADISKYIINYRVLGGSSWTEVDTGSTVTSHVLTGLTEATDYEVKVAAYNSGGTGIFSDVSDFSTIQSSENENEPINVGPTLDKFQDDIDYGFIEVTGSDPLDTSKITFTTDYTIIAGSAEVVIPGDTEMTRTGGGSMDFTTMTLGDITESIRNAYVGTIAGAVSVGIPNLKLSFSQNISVTIPVGSSYNGQTLDVYYQNEGEEDWNSGLTCTVASGLCTFQTNHATKYSAGDRPEIPSNNNSNDNNNENLSSHTPLIAVGKHRVYLADSDKVNLVSKPGIALRGRISELARGRVELYQDSHKLKRIKINRKGRWRVTIHLKRKAISSYRLKYFNSLGQETETTPFYQIKVR